MSLGVQPHATVQFEMSSLDPENYPIKPVKPQQECNMPDVITVKVQTGRLSFSFPPSATNVPLYLYVSLWLMLMGIFFVQSVSLSLTLPVSHFLPPLDADTYQDVVVEIERTTRKNPFLGGYCHKVTKTDYHHAGVQTVARKRPDRGVEMFSRDTQVKAMELLTRKQNIYSYACVYLYRYSAL